MSSPPSPQIDFPPVPKFLYGTAWKEIQTAPLVRLAIQCGFRGIDTANQRKHYFEAAVGQAVQEAITEGLVRREDLFLQTKFTFQAGQDHRLPYDPAAPIAVQVEQSLASSLEHLKTEWIDSYLLHGPSRRIGLTATDWDAWHAMERQYERGVVRRLGVSNVTLEQLQALCQSAKVQPSSVQNRCYAVQAWDRGVRAFCANHGLTYQGFSLLTANRDLFQHPELTRIARRHGRSLAQVIFRFALDVGMLPLTGTTNAEHMQLDLKIFDFQLTQEDVEKIEYLAVS